MSLTFYVAASSADHERAKACMRDLEALNLVNKLDWTRTLDAPESEWPNIAGKCIDAACDAGVFVALAPLSLGAAAEVGARLGVFRRAHLVGEWLDAKGRPHVFAKHECVTVYADWRAFIEASEGRVK